MTFEFGVNSHAHNKQPIGGFEALTKNWETKRGTVSDLVAWVDSGKPIMVGTLADTNTRRLKSNILSAQAIALDIDDGLSLEDCLALPVVKDYAAAIYTSASHKKQKGDKPACDRYRLIFVLPQAVTDTALYEAAVALLMGQVGYADRACRDASRMFYGYDGTEVILCDATKALPAAFIEEARDRLEAEKLERQRNAEERRRYLEEFEVNGEDQLELIKTALDCISPNLPHDEWLRVGMALHSHDAGLFHLWDSWSSGGETYPGSRSLERQWSKFTQGGGVTLGTLFTIAQGHGFKFPQRRHQPRGKRKGDRLVSGLEYTKVRVSEFIQHLNEKAQAQAKTFGQLLKATTKPITEAPAVIRWNNGDPLPTPDDYEGRPIPKIIYGGKDDHETTKAFIALVIGLYDAGWGSVLDSSFMGSGKSHRAGAIELLQTFARQWYLDVNHNNPSVPAIAQAYKNLLPRHRGLWLDDEGRLTRQAQGTAKPVEQSNCPSADLFPLLAAKGWDIEGTDNPVCGACDRRNWCHTAHFSYKGQRANTLAQPKIRAAIESLPNPTTFDYGKDLAIVEEATGLARAALLEVNGGFKNLLEQFHILKRKAPELYKKLEPLELALAEVFEAPQGRYGLDHDDIIKALPALPEGLDLLAIAAALQPELELAETDKVTGAGKKFKRLERSVNREFRNDAHAKNAYLIDGMPNNLLLPLLAVLSGDRGALRLELDKLTVTRADSRKQAIVGAFGFRVFLDATGNKQAIANGFGLAQNGIIEIQQEQPPLNNLVVFQTHLSGIKSRDRSASAEKRVEAYQNQWRDTDPNVKFIGFKGEQNDGYWFRDNRGSNKFKGRINLCSIGVPFPHVGAIKAEYRALVGNVDGFEGYYRRLVEDEITQLIGRQRVQRYPEAQFTLDIVATYGEDFDLSFLVERFGVEVVSRKAVEFCFDAGTVKERIKHQMIEVGRAVKEATGKLTQEAIANALGTTRKTLRKHIEQMFGSWLAFQKLLDTFLGGTTRELPILEPTNMAGDPIIAASLLIELFCLGGWGEITQFLRSAPPPERQKYLAALLQTAAIA